MFKVIATLILSLGSAVLYRIGGIGKPFRSWMRDWTIPFVGLGTILLLNIKAPFWVHIASIGLYGAALSTYWDSIFGYDNFYAHGFMCGLAYLPYGFALGLWWQIILRALICGLLVGLWSKFQNVDWKEEGGRGFILNITILLLTISK